MQFILRSIVFLGAMSGIFSVLLYAEENPASRKDLEERLRSEREKARFAADIQAGDRDQRMAVRDALLALIESKELGEVKGRRALELLYLPALCDVDLIFASAGKSINKNVYEWIASKHPVELRDHRYIDTLIAAAEVAFNGKETYVFPEIILRELSAAGNAGKTAVEIFLQKNIGHVNLDDRWRHLLMAGRAQEVTAELLGMLRGSDDEIVDLITLCIRSADALYELDGIPTAKDDGEARRLRNELWASLRKRLINALADDALTAENARMLFNTVFRVLDKEDIRLILTIQKISAERDGEIGWAAREAIEKTLSSPAADLRGHDVGQGKMPGVPGDGEKDSTIPAK